MRHLRWFLAFTVSACSGQGVSDEASQPPASNRVTELLAGGDLTGFERAVQPREFVWPQDHGAHPTFRNEWWYLTANLRSEDGRRFGCQWTLFRTALIPPRVSSDDVKDQSAFRTETVWLAHFAVTDVAAEVFHSFERFSRGSPGLAGAQVPDFRLWLDDWSVASVTADAAAQQVAADDARGVFPLRMQSAGSNEAGAVAIDFTLQAGKPLVLQGERGLSRKSPEPGNASFYWSMMRLPIAGTIETPGVDGPVRVSGNAWLDREWSTSVLAADQTGWDWFALQLEDGTELMVYRLRSDAASGKSGGMHPSSAGVFVDASGSVSKFTAADLELVPGDRESNGGYPLDWTVKIEALDLELVVQAAVAEQEHRGRFRYWEGVVDVQGSRGGAAVSGVGYLEMTPR